MSTANYIRNRCPSRNLGGKSAFENWTGTVPNVEYFKEFGCPTYYLINKPNKGKFDPRSKREIFVGYAEKSKAYRIWVPDDRKIEIARNIKFLENLDVKSSDDYREISLEETAPVPSDCLPECVSDNPGFNMILDLHNNDCSANQDEGRNDEQEDQGGDDEIASRKRGPGRPRKVITGRRGRPQKQYNMVDVANAEPERVFVAEVPLNQAISSPEADEWLRAMAVELKCIIRNDTWKLVERPKDTRVIGSQVVLCNKYKPYGSLER